MCCRKLWDVRVCRSEALDRKGMRMCFDLTDLPAGRLLQDAPKTIACPGASAFALQVSFHPEKTLQM